MKVIGIMNHKGGVGKSTCSKEVAAALTRLGNRVLVIDVEGQSSNISRMTKADKSYANEATLYEVLKGKVSPADAIQELDCFDIIVSNGRTSALDEELKGEKAFYALHILCEALKADDLYDYVIIDGPPTQGFRQTLVIYACDYIIGVVTPNLADIEGIADLCKDIIAANQSTEKQRYYIGNIMNKADKRSPSSLTQGLSDMQKLSEVIEKRFPEIGTLFTVTVPLRKFIETCFRNRDICVMSSPYDDVSVAFKKIVKTMLEKINELDRR